MTAETTAGTEPRTTKKYFQAELYPNGVATLIILLRKNIVHFTQRRPFLGSIVITGETTPPCVRVKVDLTENLL
jgi:hypothetical protein